MLDALAGRTLERLANAEQQAQRGEVVADEGTMASLGDLLELSELRRDDTTGWRIGVVQAIRQPVAADALASAGA